MDKKINEELEKLASKVTSFVSEAEKSAKTIDTILKEIERLVKVEGLLWERFVKILWWITGCVIVWNLIPVFAEMLKQWLR